MERKYFWIINSIYIVLIPAWLVLKSASLGFDVGFSWEIQPDMLDKVSVELVVVNSIILLSSSAVLVVIGLNLVGKFLTNKKDAPLLLGTMNLVLGGGLAWDGIRKYTTFASDEFRNAGEAVIFVLLSWAIIMLLLFLQDIFTGSFKHENHQLSQIVFAVLNALAVFFLMGWPAFIPLDVSTITGYAFLIATIIPLSVWQLRATYALVKGTKDKRTRQGLSMIGYSAIFYLSVLATVAFKKLWFPLDLLLSLLLLGMSVTMYLGFIRPSRTAERAESP
ncbi:MAG: hypothetical protein JW839_18910 [Candidatus Lokiarchaeota archaeon]|nr:hypothetical protein [Candidatus Lokiarchaeota archaeon]